MLFKTSNLKFIALAGALSTSSLALADHNSIWGEGWANMPNDIHNTRIDTMDEDSSVFRDFITQGGGTDSVNRFLEDDSDSFVSSMGGSPDMGSNGGGNDTTAMSGGNGGNATSGGSRR